jgi:hypothetical protein
MSVRLTMADVKVYVLIVSPPTDVDVRRKAIVYQLTVVVVQVYLYSTRGKHINQYTTDAVLVH